MNTVVSRKVSFAVLALSFAAQACSANTVSDGDIARNNAAQDDEGFSYESSFVAREGIFPFDKGDAGPSPAPTQTYSVRGAVEGLPAGVTAQLRLKWASDAEETISANGVFTFARKIEDKRKVHVFVNSPKECDPSGITETVEGADLEVQVTCNIPAATTTIPVQLLVPTEVTVGVGSVQTGFVTGNSNVSLRLPIQQKIGAPYKVRFSATDRRGERKNCTIENAEGIVAEPMKPVIVQCGR
jgi:hypothetical protein